MGRGALRKGGKIDVSDRKHTKKVQACSQFPCTQTSGYLWTLQQEDLAVDHAVANHSPEHGRLRADGADAVGARLHQRLLVDIMKVAESLIDLLPQLPGVTVELRRLHLSGGKL